MVLSGSYGTWSLYMDVWNLYPLHVREAVLLVGLLSELFAYADSASLPQWAECCYLCQLLLSVLPECHFFRGISAEAGARIPLCGSDVLKRHRLSAITVDLAIYAAHFAARTGAVCRSLSLIGPVMRTLFCLMHGMRKQIRELFRNGIFSHAASFQQIDRSRSLIILSLTNRTPPVFTYLPLLTDISGWSDGYSFL